MGAPPPLFPPSFPPPSSPPALPPAAPEDDAAWTVIVGILLGLTASVGINVGNNLQSLGLQKERQVDGRKPFVWKVGACIFGVASLVNFGAFGFAPAAVLAPLESIQFVTNLIFGKFVNGKTIKNRMIYGSALVIAGCVIAVIFGPNQVARFSVEELTDFWADTWWILYLSFLAGFATAAQLVHNRFERARRNGHPFRHDHIIPPVAFATSSAVIGSMCVVMSKCMSELVEIFVTGRPDVLASPLFYISLVLTVIFLCAWLYRLNEALGKYDPLFIIPLLQSNYILFSITSGGVYFQEFSMLGTKEWVLFVLGIAVMFCGNFLLRPTSDADASAAAPPAAAPAAEGRRCSPTAPADKPLDAAGGMLAAQYALPFAPPPADAAAAPVEEWEARGGRKGEKGARAAPSPRQAPPREPPPP